MIGVAAKTYDLDGAWIFQNDSASVPINRSASRRQSRTATLDGSVSIIDFGYADGDRDIMIIENYPSREAVDFVKYILETYSLVNVCTEDGAYSAAPVSHEVDKNGKLIFNLMIAAKLS